MAQKRKTTKQSPRRSRSAAQKTTQTRRVKQPLPWAIFWLAVMMLSDLVLPPGWIALWSREDTPDAAQTAVLLGGFLATTVFLHAIVVVQMAVRDLGDDALQAARRTYHTALARTGIGVLVGTTLVFLQYGGDMQGTKVTSILSDAATVGGIVGLLACVPYNLRITFTTLRRLRVERLPHWFTIHITLAVIDTYLLYRLLVIIEGIL